MDDLTHVAKQAGDAAPDPREGDARAQRSSGPRVTRLPEPEMVAPGPALPDFVSSDETRLRDLLAFGMAVEAGRPLGPDGVDGLRRKAEGDLHAFAFRHLHNQVEVIRREAAAEQIARTPRAPGFGAIVLANLVAIASLIGGALLAARFAPPDLLDHLAQLLAHLTARI